jgi:hypothetical protein
MADWKDSIRRTPLAGPTAGRTADQSTQENSTLHATLKGVRPGPGPELAHEADAEDVLNRSAGRRYWTPRRYEDRTDPALPSDDSWLNTKI